jgi:predicted 3-demethylubiquinone-9 3-methyltransferase (glyoxalase superfamily)
MSTTATRTTTTTRTARFMLRRNHPLLYAFDDADEFRASSQSWLLTDVDTIEEDAMLTPYPCLWFDGKAEEAAEFYTRLLPDSQVDKVWRSPAETPSGPAGMVLTVDFTLAGQRMQALNGGPEFRFNEAVSFVIECDDQAEVDRLWDALSADGGEPGPCGWLKDRYGLSWQIVPRELIRLMEDPDPERARRAMEAMLKMGKIEVEELRMAADAA